MMLVLRSTWATIIMMFMINTNAKKILYDGVGKGDIFPIAFRSVQSTIFNIINFMATAVIPLVIIGVINNMSPLCCVVLCYFFLGEKLSKGELILLFLILGCIIDVVVEAPDSTANNSTKSIS